MDSAIERFDGSVAYDAIDAHEDDPTYQNFANAINPDFTLSREVQPLDGRYLGRVEKHFYKRGVEYRHQRRMYNVRYYNDSLSDEREVDENGKPLKKPICKRALYHAKEELLSLLLVSDEKGPAEEDDEDKASGGSDMEIDSDE